jgi:hypothetical protein
VVFPAPIFPATAMCFGFFVLAISTTQVSIFSWRSADDPQFKDIGIISR